MGRWGEGGGVRGRSEVLGHVLLARILALKSDDIALKLHCPLRIICSKHRLWALVRTASPQFYYIKVGFKGVKTK